MSNVQERQGEVKGSICSRQHHPRIWVLVMSNVHEGMTKKRGCDVEGGDKGCRGMQANNKRKDRKK